MFAWSNLGEDETCEPASKKQHRAGAGVYSTQPDQDEEGDMDTPQEHDRIRERSPRAGEHCPC
eukprot:6478069-Amphidinium_carterae.1